MWTLQHKTKDQIIYIGGAKAQYDIGRSACDIILSNDTSISRKHASLQHSTDSLKVIDHNSRYGTFVNDHIDKIEKIEPNVVWPLTVNDRIKFGRLEQEFTVGKVELHTMCSTIGAPEKAAVEKCLNKMSGSVMPEFGPRVTHLTMPQITITLKLIESLVAGVPVVTPAFWEKCLEAVAAGHPLPDPAAYTPILNDEGILIEESVSFKPNPARKSLFSGKTFYFLSKRYAERFETIIKAAGGKCFSLDKKKVQKSLLVKTGAIVVQRSVGFSQESQMSQTVDAVADYVRSKGKRMIPESEIGLAVLHCSVRRHCNPDYDFPTAFGAAAACKPIKSDILVKNTVEVFGMPGSVPSQAVEIPESQSGSKESMDYEAPASVTIHDSSDEDVTPLANISAKRRQSARSTQPSKRIALEAPSAKPAPTIKVSASMAEAPPPPKVVEIMDSDSEPEMQFERLRPKAPEPPKKSPKSVPKPAPSIKISESMAKAPPPSKIADIVDSDSEPEMTFERAAEPPKKAPPPQPSVATKRSLLDSSDDDVAKASSDEEPGSVFGFQKRAKKQTKPKSPVEKFEAPTMVETLTLTSQPAMAKKPMLSKPTGPPLYKPKVLQRLFSPDIKAIDISSIGWLDTTLNHSVTVPETQPSGVDEVDVKEEPIDEYCLSIEELTQLWLRSLKNAFRINSKVVKLEGKSGLQLSNISRETMVATPSVVSDGRPNFKAFVKAQNYIPQVEIVSCRPFVVRKNEEDVD